jgi:hypothetical protein
VFGGKYVETEYSEERARYWNGRYRLESVVELEELLESSMTAETFRSISQPSLTLYYYKNENEQDPEVSVSAIQDMHRVLATPDSLKILKAMPNAGAHVLGSSLTSHDVEGVYNEIETFAQTKLRMPKSQSLAMNK